jgi:hypothetical protein
MLLLYVLHLASSVDGLVRFRPFDVWLHQRVALGVGAPGVVQLVTEYEDIWKLCGVAGDDMRAMAQAQQFDF